MIHGPTIPRASHARSAKEQTTIPASQRPGRDARATYRPSSTSARRRASSRSLRRAGLDADLRGSPAHIAEHRVRHRLAAGRLLERGCVEVGRASEVVLALDERERCGRHRPASVVVAGEQLERRVQRLRLALVDRNPQRDLVGQLGEPADVADDHRLAERERADHAAGRLAHRRRAQVDADVARGHQRPQPVLLHIRLADDALVGQSEPLQAAVEVEAGRDRADEQEPRVRPLTAQPCERLEQLRDPLARVQVPEAADERARPRRPAGATGGTGQAGCGIRQTGPSNPAARARSST